MGSSVRLREALSAGGPGGTSKDKATADGVLTRTNESNEGRAISPIDAAAAAAGVVVGGGGAGDDNAAGKDRMGANCCCTERCFECSVALERKIRLSCWLPTGQRACRGRGMP